MPVANLPLGQDWPPPVTAAQVQDEPFHLATSPSAHVWGSL